ncbi:MAG TPA: aspartate/glutamate racemase family protein [Candidatus Angelobacter sp.]|nr:aspartate/glutamate racemase family protein [Candidatus Angelobacter sp.]
MKQKTLGLVHTSATLVPVFAQLCKEKLPDVKVFNIVDDSLVKGIMTAGSLTAAISRRVAGYLESAELAGADYVLVTCSSIGPAVDAGAKLTGVPVLRVDQPMADKAVATGKKVGVVATLRTTLEPTADLIARRAAAAGKKIELTSKLCEGAFDALMSGDAAMHDAKVAAVLKELSREMDVIVLAQASMARVVETLAPADKRVPILASPGIAVDYLATVLK